MRFIVWGDSKGKDGINEKALNSILKQAVRLEKEPEFMVMCGDTVKGGEDEEILLHQLFELKNIIDKYYPNVPLLPVIGNHEVNINPIDDRFEKIISSFYYNLKPDKCLENYNKSVYYLDFDNTRIIVLNSFRPGETHRINKEQLKWLENVSYNCDLINKILFVHSPPFPTGAHLGHCLDLYPEERDQFWNMVEKSNIDIVFCGHEHNYSRRLISKNKDIYQIISGGAGEKLKNKYKSKKGVIVPPKAQYHFVIVEVEGTCIRCCAINNKGKKIDEFIINKN